MKVTTRKIELTAERTETVRLQLRDSIRVWCAACGTSVDMVAPELASSRLPIKTRTIYRLIEAGQVHSIESDSGQSLVCLDSLQRELQK